MSLEIWRSGDFNQVSSCHKKTELQVRYNIFPIIVAKINGEVKIIDCVGRNCLPLEIRVENITKCEKKNCESDILFHKNLPAETFASMLIDRPTPMLASHTNRGATWHQGSAGYFWPLCQKSLCCTKNAAQRKGLIPLCCIYNNTTCQTGDVFVLYLHI